MRLAALPAPSATATDPVPTVYANPRGSTKGLVDKVETMQETFETAKAQIETAKEHSDKWVS